MTTPPKKAPALLEPSQSQLIVIIMKPDLAVDLSLGFEITAAEGAFSLKTPRIPWVWKTNEYETEILRLVMRTVDPFKWAPNIQIFLFKLEQRLKALDPPGAEKINRRPDHLNAYLRWRHAAEVNRAPEEIAWRKQEFLDAIGWGEIAWG